MPAVGPAARRPRFTCMGLNAAGRPVPMFDPFFDGQDDMEKGPPPAGPVELLLFGARGGSEADDASPKCRKKA